MDLLRPGHIIADRFMIAEHLGQGGFGNVYRASDLTLDRPVAVKIFIQRTADTASSRFMQEATFTAKIEHENAVRLYDAGSDEVGYYLILEYVDGVPAQKFFVTNRDPLAAALVTMQIARALTCAHTLGIIHRDVKPSNILVTPSGLTKLNDFGIASMMEQQSGSMTASWDYASPEQYRGVKLSGASDVFSLGLSAFTFFAGKSAFPKNDVERLRKMERNERPQLAAVMPELNTIGVLIDRMLEFEPELRPSANEVADQLRQWLLPHVPSVDIGLAVARTAAATRPIDVPRVNEHSLSQSGIVDACATRLQFETRYPLAEIIANLAQGRFRVVGKTLGSLADSPELLKQALRNGATLEFSLLDPEIGANAPSHVSRYDVSSTLERLQRDVISWMLTTRPPGKLYLKQHRDSVADSFVHARGPNINLIFWELSFGRSGRDKRIFVIDPPSGLGPSLTARYDRIFESAQLIYQYDNRRSVIDQIPTIRL